MGNDHGRPKDIVGEVRQAFTSTADTAFDVCLENQLFGRSKSHQSRGCERRRKPLSSQSIKWI
jgi:hypothetical protein